MMSPPREALLPGAGVRQPRAAEPVQADADRITGAVIDERVVRAVIHVARGAAAGGDGSSARPFPSVRPALELALENLAAGIPTRVRLAPGVYREFLGELRFASDLARTTLLVIEGAENGRTVISGSDVFPPAGWETLGNGLYAHAWTHDLGMGVDPWFPTTNVLSMRAEMVFINGRALNPVALEAYRLGGFWDVETPEHKRGEMRAEYVGRLDPAVVLGDWTFGVTERPENGRKLYVKVPPALDWAGARIEAAVRPALLEMHDKENLVLRNLTFTHAANRARHDSDVIRWHGAYRNVLIEGCQFVWNSAFGLSLNRIENLTVRDTRINYNGFGGAGIGDISNALWTSCETSFNDWRNLLSGDIYAVHCTGGIKAHKATDMRVRDHLAAGNFLSGLWFDVNCRNIVVEDSVCVFNAREGLFFELSTGPCLARRNLLAFNGYSSYAVDIVGDTLAEANIIYNGIHPWLGNRGYSAVSLSTGVRGNEHAALMGDRAAAMGNSHTLRDNVVAGPTHMLLSWANRVGPDHDHPQGRAIREAFDGAYAGENNRFFSVHDRKFKFEHDAHGLKQELTFAEWLAYQGSNEMGAQWGDPRFTDPDGLDFTLRPDSPLAVAPGDLPLKAVPPEVLEKIQAYFRWAGWM